MNAYTKGPWRTNMEEVYEVRDAHDRRICIITHLRGKYGLGGRRIDGEAAANTRLIAAAPELLEALKLAGNLFASNHAISQFDWGKSVLRAEDIRELNEVPLAIRAAIAKAEGRS